MVHPCSQTFQHLHKRGGVYKTRLSFSKRTQHTEHPLQTKMLSSRCTRGTCTAASSRASCSTVSGVRSVCGPVRIDRDDTDCLRSCALDRAGGGGGVASSAADAPPDSAEGAPGGGAGRGRLAILGDADGVGVLVTFSPIKPLRVGSGAGVDSGVAVGSNPAWARAMHLSAMKKSVRTCSMDNAVLSCVYAFV